MTQTFAINVEQLRTYKYALVVEFLVQILCKGGIICWCMCWISHIS